MSLDKVPKLSPQVKVLMYLFGFVYFSQGIAQFSGLMSQPLTFYFNSRRSKPSKSALVVGGEPVVGQYEDRQQMPLTSEMPAVASYQ